MSSKNKYCFPSWSTTITQASQRSIQTGDHSTALTGHWPSQDSLVRPQETGARGSAEGSCTSAPAKKNKKKHQPVIGIHIVSVSLLVRKPQFKHGFFICGVERCQHNGKCLKAVKNPPDRKICWSINTANSGQRQAQGLSCTHLIQPPKKISIYF